MIRPLLFPLFFFESAAEGAAFLLSKLITTEGTARLLISRLRVRHSLSAHEAYELHIFTCLMKEGAVEACMAMDPCCLFFPAQHIELAKQEPQRSSTTVQASFAAAANDA